MHVINVGCRISSIYSNNRVLLRQPAHFYYNHAVYTIVVLNSIDMLTMVRLNYATDEGAGGGSGGAITWAGGGERCDESGGGGASE